MPGRPSKPPSEPECRALRDDEFEADGFPNQHAFGPLETLYALGPINSAREPHWLARYNRLPAYLGIGKTPMEAVMWLQALVATRPLFKVSITRFSRQTLKRQLSRQRAAMFAAAEIGEERKRTDWVVKPIAAENHVRPADALRIAKIYRENPLGSPKLETLRAAKTEVMNIYRENGLLRRNDEGVETFDFAKDIQLEHLTSIAENQRHPWEYEMIWARMKMPVSGI